MSNDLLPPNATELERNLSKTAARISNVPALPHLWNADACPVELLPWLAWAEQVPEWSSKWSEPVQRSSIKAMRAIRRKRGTAGAVKDALNSLNLGVNISEWFEYAGTPGTFSLKVDLFDRGLTLEEQESIERVIAQTKNTRSHLDSFNISITQNNNIFYGSTVCSGDETTLYPLIITELEQLMQSLYATCIYDAETTTIYPLTN